MDAVALGACQVEGVGVGEHADVLVGRGEVAGGGGVSAVLAEERWG